ncbi:Kinesin-like protein [Hondaea fermentalgiana]|uniref:Kinesin-like protein n=1 Tax=Hondaea fermentalgiana TaxID=2315210 RepID=A0A2R5GY82_9STRA|nr:Kinesin-like protein [Hondaea fermentalgiana]|eukprot:GBG32934.1 Kinesin-like protein [Hondaea fermentalgiana]
MTALKVATSQQEQEQDKTPSQMMPAQTIPTQDNNQDHDRLAGPESSIDEDAQDQEQSSAIKVVVRVRPLLKAETKTGARQTVLGINVENKEVRIDLPGTNGRRTFGFDAVLDESQQQTDVFEKAGMPALIESVLHGYDGTVFAYGQTGSGKTHTMEGFTYAEHAHRATVEPQLETTDETRYGITPRVAEALFARMRAAERDENVQFRVRCSYMQIYNEKILDLLNPQHLLLKEGREAKATVARRVDPSELAGLRMRFSSASNHFYVENLQEVECTSAQDVMEQFRIGVRAKVMGSHKLNAASSRSHCMFSIRIDTLDVTRPDEPKYSSRLALVDLAGSERVAVTRATGKTLKEAGCINKSLFALRNVITAISALQEKQATAQLGDAEMVSKLRHIPFRDSKLTSLLQHCLGGSSHTIMIACVSPSDAHAEENLSTLAYASRAKAIRNKPRRNEDAKSRLIRKLKREVRLLRRQLQQAQEVTGMQLGQGAAAVAAASAASHHGGRVSRAGNGSTNAPTPDPEVKHLKHELLGSINIMRRMHEIEKELRERMEEAEEDVKSLQVDNSKLHDENQRLREHEQVLLHLLERGAETELCILLFLFLFLFLFIVVVFSVFTNKKSRTDICLIAQNLALKRWLRHCLHFQVKSLHLQN